jgi:hypothetical protein
VVRLQGIDVAPVKKCCRVFLILLAILASSICAQSQTSVKSKTIRPSPPELRVKVISSKETYFLREDVFTKTEFLNLTDKTLCFPEPAQDVQVDGSGYLTVTAGHVNAETRQFEEEEFFIDHYSGGLTFPREKLVSEIEQSWVKLPPNQVYVLKSTRQRVNLSTSGQWQLRAAYHPPACSFNVAECTRYLRSAAESIGCTVPETVVIAEPGAVNVVPTPEQKQSIK